MKRTFYKARLENGIFYIHKFSARFPFISTVKVGFAYTKGYHSEYYCKALSKYELHCDDTYLTSFNNMIERIYVGHKLSKVGCVVESPIIYKVIESTFFDIRRKKVDDAIFLLQLEGHSIYNNKNELL